MSRLPERVWLLRHAETATPALFHGAESDVGLSDLGRGQAAAAGQWFRDQKPTVVVSSGMRRAVDTASPIATACGVPHRIEPDLHERRVGALCGVPFASTEGPWAETVREWAAGNSDFTTPGAESFDDLSRRLIPAWTRIIEANPGARVVVVAHGIVSKVLLLSLVRGWDVTGWSRIGRVPNLAVSELIPDAGLWAAERLLIIPEPVAALTEGRPTEVGVSGVRSEA